VLHRSLVHRLTAHRESNRDHPFPETTLHQTHRRFASGDTTGGRRFFFGTHVHDSTDKSA